MRRGRRFLALGLAAGMLSSCDADPVRSTQRPSWLLDAKIEPLGAAPAFERNSEVFLKIHNPTDRPLVIQSLNASGAALLVHNGGARAKIHRISVGVTKPIVVPPHGTKQTSLLFEAANGVPATLRLYDKEFGLPQGADLGHIRGPGSGVR